MKKISIAASVLVLTLAFNLAPSIVSAQSEKAEQVNQVPVSSDYERAKVTKIFREDLADNSSQEVEIKILTGPDTGKIFPMHHEFFKIQKSQKLEIGNEIVVSHSTDENGKPNYIFLEKYRLVGLFWSVMIFFAIGLIIGKRKTIGALIGLIITILILVYGIIPAVIAGADPLFVTMIASVIITLALYISHGIHTRTHISVASMLLSILVAIIAVYLFTYLSHLTGAATEDVYFLQSGPLKNLDLKNLLMSGMILGALGVLDDVVTAQAAAVEELHRANNEFSWKQLYIRGMSIGREHIASLINTLFLAYAGAAFAGIIMAISSGVVPVWLALNNEQLIEEIIRTIVGSTALICAVPIATLIAARTFGKK
ncbi:MAG: YibE/F family protein [Patescibacteria group bacterium]